MEASCHTFIRSSAPGSIPASSFLPGSQLLVRIKHAPGDLSRAAWCRTLMTKSRKEGEVMVVVDDPILMNSSCGIQNGDVISVLPTSVAGVIPSEEGPPVVTVVMQDGVLAGMRRTDGRTQSIIVRLDEDDRGQVFKVNHKGFTLIEK